MKHFSQRRKIARIIALTPATKEMKSPKMWMMKRTINGISNLRDQAQSPCAQDLEQALPLGLQIDSDKNLQTKGDVVLLHFVYILRMRWGGIIIQFPFGGN